MNHTRLPCQHRAVLARRSWLQDTGVSLLFATTPVSRLRAQGTPRAAPKGGSGICMVSIFCFDGMCVLQDHLGSVGAEVVLQATDLE